jgi:hypothetical protein
MYCSHEVRFHDPNPGAFPRVLPDISRFVLSFPDHFKPVSFYRTWG